MCWWEKTIFIFHEKSCTNAVVIVWTDRATKPRKRSFTFCLLSNAFWRKKTQNVQVEVEGCDDPQNTPILHTILCNFLFFSLCSNSSIPQNPTDAFVLVACIFSRNSHRNMFNITSHRSLACCIISSLFWGSELVHSRSVSSLFFHLLILSFCRVHTLYQHGGLSFSQERVKLVYNSFICANKKREIFSFVELQKHKIRSLQMKQL